MFQLPILQLENQLKSFHMLSIFVSVSQATVRNQQWISSPHYTNQKYLWNLHSCRKWIGLADILTNQVQFQYEKQLNYFADYKHPPNS